MTRDFLKLTFTETLRSELEERLDFFTNCGDIDYRREFMITYCRTYPVLHKEENLDQPTFREYTAEYSYKVKPNGRARQKDTAVLRFNANGRIVAVRFIEKGVASGWVVLGNFFSIPDYYKYMSMGTEKKGDLAASLSRKQ